MKLVQIDEPADFLRNMEEFRQREVIIYGAGKIGQRVYRLLTRYGVTVRHFWDLNAEAIGDRVGSASVVKPDFRSVDSSDADRVIVFVTVFSENVTRKISEDLKSAGFLHIVFERAFINSLLHSMCLAEIDDGVFEFDLNTCHLCPVQKDDQKSCDIFEKQVSRHLTMPAHDHGEKGLVIRSMGILISSKCNLTCVGCNHLRDHYERSNNIDLVAENVLADLQLVSGAADFIKTVVLVGGEAFLHRDVGKIIENILAMPKIGILHIITNGTVIPKDQRVFDLLANPRVFVEISGYGDRIPERLQAKRRAFIKRLAELAVNHRYVESLQWTDFGGFEHRGYTEDALHEVYSSCCFVSNDMFDGKLYKCSRSAYGTFIGRVPDYPSDYVDIRSGSPEELRQNLLAFFEDEHPRVCNHCNGTGTQTIEAGRQVDRRLRAPRSKRSSQQPVTGAADAR